MPLKLQKLKMQNKGSERLWLTWKERELLVEINPLQAERTKQRQYTVKCSPFF